MKNNYKKISNYKKRKIVKLYREGASVSDLAKAYGLSSSSIYNWIARYSKRIKRVKLIPVKEYNDLKSHAAKLERELQILWDFTKGLDIARRTKYSFMDQVYGKWSLHELCAAMDVDMGTYHNHLRSIDKQSAREAHEAYYMDEIMKSYLDSHRTYGAERIKIDLAKRGIILGERYIRELMHVMQIGRVRPGKKEKHFNAWINRKETEFLETYTVDGVNQLWVTDMLEFNFRGKKYYTCVYLDAYSRRLLYLKLGPRRSTNHAARGLRTAYASRNPKKHLILHCDHGGENCSFTMNRLCAKLGIKRSYSRRSHPQDNPIMEAFYKTLRTELLYIGDFFHSVVEFERRLAEFMDFYNNQRIHTSLNGCTPVEYEQKYPHVKKQVRLQRQTSDDDLGADAIAASAASAAS